MEDVYIAPDDGLWAQSVIGSRHLRPHPETRVFLRMHAHKPPPPTLRRLVLLHPPRLRTESSSQGYRKPVSSRLCILIPRGES